VRSSKTEKIALAGIQAREAHKLSFIAEAVGLAVRPLAFGTRLADAALGVPRPGTSACRWHSSVAAIACSGVLASHRRLRGLGQSELEIIGFSR
jgi:hypothetical protein